MPRLGTLALSVALPLAALVLPRWYLVLRYGGSIHELSQAPARPTAIVFGAGLVRSGAPSPVLADRVQAAANLYRMGLVGRILLSGSTRGPTYDEPAAMRELALGLGVPDSAIDMDRGGTRTLETCLRARDLFGVRSALLVSQRYHLPRALTLCDALGIDAVGAAADLRPYSQRLQRIWGLREIPACFVALWESLWLRISPRADGSALVGGDPHGA